MLTAPTTCTHICAAAAPSDKQVAKLLDKVKDLVAHLRGLPGGTDRMRPEIKAVIAAYDELDGPQAVAS